MHRQQQLRLHPVQAGQTATLRMQQYEESAVHLVGDRRFIDQLGRVECQATTQQPLLSKLAEAATLQQITCNVATSDK
jgi:hypothetical protein